MTCRVLKLVRQDYCRWLASTITASELEEAYLANALFDAHCDDPEFGYRFLADEVKNSGFSACERTVWKICSPTAGGPHRIRDHHDHTEFQGCLTEPVTESSSSAPGPR